MASNVDRQSGSADGVFLAISGGLFVTLLLGSYIYTWNESVNQAKEKVEWRNQHEHNLDKKFEEVRVKQDKIETAIHDANQETITLLNQLVEDKKKRSK